MNQPARRASAPSLARSPAAISHDRKRALVLAALGLVPHVGGPARALLEQVWGSALDRRLSTFVDLLLAKVADLELATEELQRRMTSPTTAAVGMLAVGAASRAGDDEKLDRVAEGLTNVIKNHDAWTGQVDHALRLLDETTTTQFAILDYFDDPIGWLKRRDCPVDVAPDENGRLPCVGVMALAFPGLAVQPAVLHAAASALETRGLMNFEIGDLEDASFESVHDFESSLLSVTGRELVRFVQHRQP